MSNLLVSAPPVGRGRPPAARSIRIHLAAALGTLVAVAAMALAPPALAAPAAAFTSVNEAVDGSGHCKNGNPAVNCNIYDGKQYVWMNGGPDLAALGNGSYFFAVIEPGTQADPRDGTAGNLSDDYDLYTNRTFSVSGGTITYGGTHDFNANKIRLADYADTSNPGRVYILAICSLAGGYDAVDPSNCKYDAFKIEAGQVVLAAAPTVVKDANGAYKKTYSWQIGKSADKTTVQQAGGSVTFTYTVTVTHDAGTVSDVTVGGTITVFNPNTDGANQILPVTGVDVTDQLSDGTSCSVTGGSGVTLSTAETTFAYSCSLASLPQAGLDNTVSVTWPTQFLGNGAVLNGDAATFTFTGTPSGSHIGFTETAIDGCIDVTDTYAGALGSACVANDPNPKTFTYQRTIAVQPGCVSYDNTASFSPSGGGSNLSTAAANSASATVTVCGPARTGALTIGFWKGPNGNSLITNYCAPTSKTSLATYLSALGAGNGPFKDAAGKSCADLVKYVNSVIGGASATNMNVMLRAQMLATALDVYFSGTSLGYSTTPIGTKVKPPSNFLTGGPIGGFTMDMTAICPMVDNTTTGTASCVGMKPSTNGFASGAFPAAAMTVQAILDYAATVPPFNGSTTTPVWYGGDRTKQETAKNVFDQINNQLAFAA